MRVAYSVAHQDIEILKPGASKQEIGEAMVRAGLRPEHLPLQGGGSWSYAQSKKWLEEVDKQRTTPHSSEVSPLDVLASAAGAVQEFRPTK